MTGIISESTATPQGSVAPVVTKLSLTAVASVLETPIVPLP